MIINIEHSGMRSKHEIDSKIEEEIFKLRELIAVEEARVRLERRKDQAPPFRVSVHIVTPGPDIRVESADHTIAAAVLKAGKEMRRCIAAKTSRRTARTKGKLQLPLSFRTARRGGDWSMRKI